MVEFDVQGMTCGGCVRSVTNAIQRIDADAVVDVDLAAKKVSVKSAANADRLMEAIQGAGYQVSQQVG